MIKYGSREDKNIDNLNQFTVKLIETNWYY